MCFVFFFFSSRRRHTRWPRDWSSDVCSSDLIPRTKPFRLWCMCDPPMHRTYRGAPVTVPARDCSRVPRGPHVLDEGARSGSGPAARRARGARPSPMALASPDVHQRDHGAYHDRGDRRVAPHRLAGPADAALDGVAGALLHVQLVSHQRLERAEAGVEIATGPVDLARDDLWISHAAS